MDWINFLCIVLLAIGIVFLFKIIIKSAKDIHDGITKDL